MRVIERIEPYREYAPLFIRLAAGAILIEGTADNVFSWSRMVEFAEFLAANGFPFPLPGAVISAYAQFICGFAFILGALTRVAGLVMAINFAAAILIAHTTGGFAPARLAMLMLAVSLFLALHGAGRASVDAKVARGAQT